MFLLLLAAPTVRAQTVYEVESAQNTYTQGTISSYWSGFSGTGFIGDLIQRGQSSVAFAVTAPAGGMYTVTARYAAALPYLWTMSVYVNGRDVTQAQFPTTGSWSSWATQTVTVALATGANTVMYRYDNDDSGYINLDYIQVTPALSAGFASGSAATAGWFPNEVAIEQFTGTAQVQLPLATVSAPGITVPVGLAYAATGVQVDDDGGAVGTNWALQAGLSIRREVRGLPDDVEVLTATEKRYGWLRYPAGTDGPKARLAAVPEVPAPGSATGCDVTEQTARTRLVELGALQRSGSGSYAMYDTEPDIFSYSLPGHTGKFVFDAEGKVRTIPYDPIQVTRDPMSAYGIPRFTIKTSDGNTYSFNVADEIQQSTTPFVDNPRFFLRNYFAFKLPAEQPVVRLSTAWHLTSIVSPTKSEVVFQYVDAPSDYAPRAGKSSVFCRATSGACSPPNTGPIHCTSKGSDLRPLFPLQLPFGLRW